MTDQARHTFKSFVELRAHLDADHEWVGIFDNLDEAVRLHDHLHADARSMPIIMWGAPRTPNEYEAWAEALNRCMGSMRERPHTGRRAA